MSNTFICRHCRIRHRKNPRLKGLQQYCNAKACQQARKNKWEREKLKKDPVYKAKRRESKKRWYTHHPGDRYQSAYRKTHPLYCENNRAKQGPRNQERILSCPAGKIVKTDALIQENLSRQGLYILFPCKNPGAKKIVKTDALIVQMLGGAEIAGDFLQDSS